MELVLGHVRLLYSGHIRRRPQHSKCSIMIIIMKLYSNTVLYVRVDACECVCACMIMILHYIIIYASAMCAYVCACMLVPTCMRTYMRIYAGACSYATARV